MRAVRQAGHATCSFSSFQLSAFRLKRGGLPMRAPPFFLWAESRMRRQPKAESRKLGDADGQEIRLVCAASGEVQCLAIPPRRPDEQRQISAPANSWNTWHRVARADRSGRARERQSTAN